MFDAKKITELNQRIWNGLNVLLRVNVIKLIHDIKLLVIIF